MQRREVVMGSRKQHHGFTLVELLVVIVVIALLVTITVVTYNGIQAQTKKSAMQSSLSTAFKKIETLRIQNGDSGYPESLGSIGINTAGELYYQYDVNNSVNPKTFCMTILHRSMIGEAYFISQASTSPRQGSCENHSTNPDYTNIASNPLMLATSESRVTVLENIHRNPGAIGGVEGFGYYAATGTHTHASVSSSWSESGNAYRFTMGNAEPNNHFDIRPAAYFEPNQRYTISYKRLRSTAGVLSSPNVYPESMGSIVSRSADSARSLAAGEVQEVWLTVVTSASYVASSNFQIYQNFNGTQTTGVYGEISDVIIYKGDYVPEYSYFSGSSPVKGSYTHEWTGAVNASSSIRKAPLMAGMSAIASNGALPVYQVIDSNGRASARVLVSADLPVSTWGRYFIFNRKTNNQVSSLTALLSVKSSVSYSPGSAAFLQSDGIGGWYLDNPMNLTADQEYTQRMKNFGSVLSLSTANFRFQIPNVIYTRDHFVDVYKLTLVEADYNGPHFK